jgi:hypothetical protein
MTLALVLSRDWRKGMMGSIGLHVRECCEKPTPLEIAHSLLQRLPLSCPRMDRFENILLADSLKTTVPSPRSAGQKDHLKALLGCTRNLLLILILSIVLVSQAG